MDTPSPANPVPARRSRAGGLLLLVLVLAAMAVAGVFGWRHWQGLQARQLAADSARQDALESRLEALRQGQRAQSQRLLQAEATNRVLRDEVLGIGQRAALIEDSLSRLADPDRHGAQALRLDQIELLLVIGQQRLQLDDDVAGALRALALAAPLLDGLDDPAYLNLRQALVQEQAALQALGADPRVRATALIDQLQAGLSVEVAADATPAAALPWYERLLGRIVRAQPTAGAGLRERADREAAIAALQIEASLARAAIERRDEAGLRHALTRIDAWLQRLHAGSQQLAAKRAQLAQLRAIELRQSSPLAGSTLQQLRSLRTR